MYNPPNPAASLSMSKRNFSSGRIFSTAGCDFKALSCGADVPFSSALSAQPTTAASTIEDLASELAGGLGLAGAINANETHCAAQAQHGSAPDIAGQNKANPASLIISAAMMLDWRAERTGEEKFAAAATAINAAIDACLATPETRTPDLGGPLGTDAFANAVAEAMAGAANG
jgi:hypothetical protein